MAAVEAMVHPPRTMLEVFEGLPEGTPVQLIENTLVMSPSPLDRHAMIVMELSSEIYQFVKRNKLGVTRVAPYDVHLDDKNIFQPDICVILNERLPLIKRRGLNGAPSLVVEVLSPGTAKYDLNEKKAAYERFGVTEYWIINPEDNVVTGYYLVNDKYQEIFKAAGILQSKLLNCKIEF